MEQKQVWPPTVLTICLLGHSAQDCAVLLGRDSDDSWETQEGRKRHSRCGARADSY